MTDSYKVSIKKSAEKELRKIPPKDLLRITEKIKALSHDPRPHGVEKMEGQERYRLRQGDWRILYTLGDSEKRVTVVKVGNRREVYR